MSFGDFGNFGSWNPKDHALNKIVFDKAYKGHGSGGGKSGNNNAGCAAVIIIIVGIILIYLLSR
jgi:hypothetical protein